MSTNDRIRACREAAGLSQEALAFKARVSVGTVHRAESGRFTPKAATVTKLAKALGVPAADLLPTEAAQ